MSEYRDSLPPEQREIYDKAIQGFVECWVQGILLRDSLPAEEAAKISNGVRSGRFTLDEMTEQIKARRREAGWAEVFVENGTG
jgi:hypothetical protein